MKPALTENSLCWINLLWGIALVNPWNQIHQADKGKGKGIAKRLKYQSQQMDFTCSSVAWNIPRPASAFEHMADCLQQQGTTLTIIVAGGAIYLRSRHTTGEFGFFGANR